MAGDSAEFFQQREAGAGHLEDATDIDRENAVPFVEVGLFPSLGMRRMGDAGIVYQGIEPAERVADRLQHRADAGIVRNVGFHQDCFGAGLLGLGLDRLRLIVAAAVIDGDVIARFREGDCRSRSNTICCPRDESSFTGRCHCLSLVSGGFYGRLPTSVKKSPRPNGLQTRITPRKRRARPEGLPGIRRRRSEPAPRPGFCCLRPARGPAP